MESLGPLYVGLELSSICPLRCSFCPQGKRLIRRKNAFISFNDIEAFVNVYNNSKHKLFINIGGLGEPLAHPKAEEIIYYIKRKTGAKIGICTNGIYLHKLRNPRLFAETLDAIVIDIKTIQRELYESVIGGSEKLRKMVLENLRQFLEFVPEGEKKIEIRLLEIPGIDYSLIEDFSEKILNEYDNVIVRVHPLMNWSREEFKEYSKHEPLPSDTTQCHYLNGTLFVDSDGLIGVCTVSLSFSKRIGHITEFNSFEEIWESKEYKNFVTYLSTNICKLCTDKFLVPELLVFERMSNRKMRHSESCTSRRESD